MDSEGIRAKILEATKGEDIGLVIAALGDVTRIVFFEIDHSAPMLSEQARKDFYEHLNSTKKRVN